MPGHPRPEGLGFVRVGFQPNENAGGSGAYYLRRPSEVWEPAPAARIAGDPLDESSTWQLTTMTIKGVTTKRPKGAEGTLQFADGQVSGQGACNHYGGTYRIDDGTLDFGEGFMITEAGCEQLQFESEFVGALSASTVFKLDGETLTLSDGTPENQLSFVPHVIHHLPLQETDWSFSGFQEEDADTVATTLPQAEFSIRFEPDGSVSGRIACNSFNGSAEIGGDGEIKIEMGDITEEGCSKRNASQETQFCEWLSLTDSYQIQRNQLLLIDSKTRNSLVFRAR